MADIPDADISSLPGYPDEHVRNRCNFSRSWCAADANRRLLHHNVEESTMPVFPHTGHTGGGLTYVQPSSEVTRVGQAAIEDVIREATAMHQLLPSFGRVMAQTDRLRDFIEATAPEVEATARELPETDPVRLAALAAVKEARYRLGLGPGDGYDSAVTWARSLGRAADELIHHERQLSVS
ncbi:DUF6415 family natural product biosynthesis protein [Streptomyces blastmyceticus]